jgi:hypothetical protein
MLDLVFGFITLIGYFLYKRNTNIALKMVISFLITIFCIIMTVKAFDLAPFKNRYITFYNFIGSLSTKELSTKELSTKELLIADSNIFSRIEEILIAYNMFKKNPLLGNGFGIKHDIFYDIGFGKIRKFTKGYIHNWFFYFLMTSGVVGTLIYSGLYIVPLIRTFKFPYNSQYALLTLTSMLSLILLNVYSLLFTSFRLITFNIFLGIFISIPPVLHSLYNNKLYSTYINN